MKNFEGNLKKRLSFLTIILLAISYMFVLIDSKTNICITMDTMWIIYFVNMWMTVFALLVIFIYNKILKEDDFLYIAVYFIALFLELGIRLYSKNFEGGFLATVFIGALFFRAMMLIMFLFRKSYIMKKVIVYQYNKVIAIGIFFIMALFIAGSNDMIRTFSETPINFWSVSISRIIFIVLIFGVLFNCKKNYEANDIEGLVINIMVLILIKSLAHKMSRLIFWRQTYNPIDLVRGELTLFLAIIVILISMIVVLINTVEDVRKSEEKYRLFYNIVDKNDNSNVFICKNKEMIYANKKAKKNYMNDENYDGDLNVLKEKINTRANKDYNDNDMLNLLKCVNDGISISTVVKDKEAVRYSINYQRLVNRYDSYNTEAYNIYTIRNIVDEVTFANEKKKFSSINNNIDEIIFITDEKFNISYVNRKCEKELLIDQNIFMNQDISNFLYYEEQESFKSIRGRIRARNEKLLEVLINIDKLTDNFNNIIGYVFICSKTEKIKKIESLSKRIEKAENIAFKRDSFTNLAHELRTPIHIIYSSLQLLNEKKDNNSLEEFKLSFEKYENTIKVNALRLLKLVNDIIDINKIDNGSLVVKKDFYNIVTLIENICDSAIPYMKSKELELIFDTQEEERYIYCDREMVERIILNLISNAIKFTPNYGYIYVNISFDENFVYISIRDTGIGIKKEKCEAVFERFNQCDNGELSKKGSGIGLSLVKTLVDMHSGKIVLNSDEGNGCDFIISLPNSKDEENESAIINGTNREISLLGDISVEFSDIE